MSGKPNTRGAGGSAASDAVTGLRGRLGDMENSVKEAVQESKENSEELKVLGTKLLEVSTQVEIFVKETKDNFDETNGYVAQMKGNLNRISDESKQTTELLR